MAQQQQQQQIPSEVEIGPASKNPIHQSVVKPQSHVRPRIKNNDLRAMVMCESCGSGLDFPFIHQRCQHVVCATCAKGRHDKLLCKACQMNFQSQHAQIIGVITVIPHSQRMADVVAAIAGREWITWMRNDLDLNNRPAFIEATSQRNEITRVSDPTYQALLTQPTAPVTSVLPGPGHQHPSRWSDDDMDDWVQYRRRSQRCCGDGCCGSIFSCIGDILCCCGLATCCGNMCHRRSRILRNIIIGIFIFIVLGWILTGINKLFTGEPTLERWIAKRPPHPLMQNIPFQNGPTVASMYEDYYSQPPNGAQTGPPIPHEQHRPGSSSIWKQRKGL